MQVKIVNGTSKKGTPYSAIKVTIGEYEGLLFPTRAEIAYIKQQFKNTSHKDFADEDSTTND